MDWSLPELLKGMHEGIEQRLAIARALFKHPVIKGDASEAIWLEFLRLYLPARYQATRAVVVDSKGQFSEQIDIVIHDRQYTPFIFQQEGQIFVPAESVYAVFEAKQSLSAGQLTYAAGKATSVRKLHRTSMPVPNIYGKADPKPLHPILAGILTLESDWNPALGQPMLDNLKALAPDGQLQLGCVAAQGLFVEQEGVHRITKAKMPTSAFLFELIARLQQMATVPMIDVRAYAAWLE